MKYKKFTIDGIPAILYGETKEQIIIAVHGLMSNKEDTVIKILAEKAVEKGYQVLSFDLPEHGERKDNNKLLPWNCEIELRKIYEWCEKAHKLISVFGCSIGAYMSLLAFKDKKIENSLFLSPIVNMEYVINQMMLNNNVSEKELKQKGKIALANGQILDWDYLTYVRSNTIDWKKPTEILWGIHDNIMSENEIDKFALKCNAKVQKVNSEHFFYTDEQLNLYKEWLSDNII
jgi:esterase/lipase